MFGPQKNSSTEENKNNSLDSSQKKDFDIEKIPIHTMQEDLENFKNPDSLHGIISSPPQEKKPAVSFENLTPKQKTSPFLNFGSESLPKSGNLTNRESQISKTEGTQPNLNFDANEKNRSIFSQAKKQENTAFPSKNHTTSKINWRLLFFFISSFALTAILITAGYYFSKGELDLSGLLKNPFSADSTAPSIPTEPPVEMPPVEKPTLSYSQTNPNYLKLEDSDLDTEKIKAVLQQYIQKVSQEGYTTPVEFIVTDQQNAPLAFNDFAAKIGLKLSQQIMENLGSNFSLFIYNDISVSRIGLSVDLSINSNSGKLTKILLQEEKTLADEINPLFFTTDYTTEKFFGNSEYAGIKIRFQNIISPDNLSVDYAIDKNKLLIGTTKLTLRAVIDRVNNITPIDLITETAPAPQE